MVYLGWEVLIKISIFYHILGFLALLIVDNGGRFNIQTPRV